MLYQKLLAGTDPYFACVSPSCAFALHCHPEIELCYCFKGTDTIVAGQKEYASLEDLFRIAEERGESPFFVLADGVEDPHNLGALIRCCEGAGVHGIIIPKAHAAGLTATAWKASAGAAEHLAVCRVSNLAQTLEILKERGLWIYACEADGQPYDKVDYKGPIAIILGSEGFGVSRLLKEKSDFVVSLPMRGKVNSLNVSCAGAIILYEAIKSR